MSEITTHLIKCKELLRPYSTSKPETTSIEKITDCLFKLLDACEGRDVGLSEKTSQILMCLSEDTNAWTDEMSENFFDLLKTLLNYQHLNDDLKLDEEPFVIFRPAKHNAPGHKSEKPQVEDDLIVEFVKESERLLINAIEFIFQYENAPDPQFLTQSSALLRQIVASAQLLNQIRFGQATQSLIVLFEHCAVVDHTFSESQLTDIFFALDTLNDLLKLCVNGVPVSMGSVIEIHNKLDVISRSLPPRPPSISGPSEQIIEVFEIFRPQKKRLPQETLEFLPDFIDESQQHLQNAEDSLVNLQDNDNDTEQISRLFRAIHTIKGAAGFLMLVETERLTHAAESLLAQIRDKQLSLSTQHFHLLFNVVTALQQNLQNLKDENIENVPNMESLIDQALAAEKKAQSHNSIDRQTSNRKEIKNQKIDHLRVKLSAMDKMLGLVAELAITKNKLESSIRQYTDPNLEFIFERLNAISRDLEHSLLSVRLQPISIAFRKLPHLVREVALQSGKKARLNITGDYYEIDKRILEGLQDPLLHLVRNAIDHGIESPEEREQNGKPIEGSLDLSVSQSDGQFVVRISDDGRGIDTERLLQKALEKNIITNKTATKLTHRQILDLVYHPGFSTKEATSKLSGRGVGMDVVKTAIERLGGVVDMQSEQGKGTHFNLQIPLTLTVLSVLVIPFRGISYLLPRHNLVEIILSGQANVESGNGVLMLQHESGMLPLTSLASVVKAPHESSTHIVVCSVGERRFALGIPAIDGFQEVITQPLNEQITELPYLDGASLLGDGSIALILSAVGIANIFQTEFRPASNESKTRQQFKIFLEVWCPDLQSLPIEHVQSISLLATPMAFETGWSDVKIEAKSVSIYTPTSMENTRVTNLVICHAENGTTYGVPVKGVGEMLSIPTSAISEATQQITLHTNAVAIFSIPEPHRPI